MNPKNQALNLPPITALEQINSLELEGVHVAQGAGTVFQKSAVMLAMLVTLTGLILQLQNGLAVIWVLPVVVLAIDFLSGFVHWFFDTQVKPGDSFLGRIAIDFLDHHVRPQRTVDVGFFVSAHRPALMVTLPLVVVSMVFQSPQLAAVVFWIGALSMWVPQTHKIAHIGGNGRFIAWLQASRLILHPASHGRHHADNSRSFCVFTGWLNPLLNKTRFWRGMESLFATVRAL